MSVSCCVIRIPFSRGFCWRKVRVSMGDEMNRAELITGRGFPGIDVQAELRLKSATTAGPGIGALKRRGTLAPNQASLEKPARIRNPTQRPGVGVAPKLEVSGLPPPPQRDGVYHVHSPPLQTTPSSHVSSPTNARSPGFALQGAVSPKGGDFHAQQPQQHARPPLLSRPRAFTQAPPMAMVPTDAMDTSPTQSLMPGSAMAARLPSTYYPSSFQKHYDQLGKLTRTSPLPPVLSL